MPCSHFRKVWFLVRGLFKWLLHQEALLGYKLMRQVKLKGVMEGDGSALKLFKSEGKNNFVALWGVVQRPVGSEPPTMLVYFVPVKQVAPNSVCPVESRADILSTGALNQIQDISKGGKSIKSLLVTDGAAVYKNLCKEHKLNHRQCVHSKGLWSWDAKVAGYGKVSVHTGLVDERWSVIKQYIPKSLKGKGPDGSMNPALWDYLYSWWLRAHYPDDETRLSLLAEHWRGEA